MSSFQEINGLTQNQANSFKFTNEDAQRILFSNSCMDIGVSSNHLKVKLERLHLKETHLQMHGTTLSEYWRNKRIPRGQRIQKAPTMRKSNEDFVKRWGEILNKCSFDLMLLIIEHVSTEASELQKEILSQEQT